MSLWTRVSAIVMVAAAVGVALPATAQDVPTLPPFRLSTLSGEILSDLDLEGQTLLLFAVPNSEACMDALRLVKDALAERSDVTAAVVTPEASDAACAMIETVSVSWPVIVDELYVLASVFGIARVPTVCLLVDGALVGILERGFVFDELVDALDDPFGNLGAWGEETSAHSVGFWRLQEPTILVFAGADCSYCHYMLPSVFRAAETVETWVIITEELEDPAPFESDAPKLTILLDPAWEISRAFGVHTVPTILLLDEDGTVVWSHVGLVEGFRTVVEAFLERTGPAE